MSLWITLHDVAVGGQRIISIGTQNGTQEIQIDLPCGLDDGDNVRYQGIGPNNSDLIVGFRIHPDKQWQRQGSTLFTDTTANVWQLITGNKVNVVDIRGNKLEVVIPPMTQPGTTLKIKGRGLPDKTGVVGDMMLRLHTRLPTAISPELMAAISKELDQ
jgi:molecular chaperone DnaJ